MYRRPGIPGRHPLHKENRMKRTLATLALVGGIVLGAAAPAFAHDSSLSGSCSVRSYTLSADNDNLSPKVDYITGPVSGLSVGQSLKNLDPSFTATGGFTIGIVWSDGFKDTVTDTGFSGGTCVGAAGKDGTNGKDGKDGKDGAQGPAGPAGPAGAAGPAGVAGPTGAAGLVGAPGTPGLPGIAGSTGAAGPAGADGQAGPGGVDGAAGSVGDAGPAGPAGQDGVDGIDGVGDFGPTGPAGLTGPAGPAGPSGPQGVAGYGYSVCPDGSVTGAGVIPDCSTPAAATTSTTTTTGPTTPVGELPHTGANVEVLGLLGLGLLVLGLGARSLRARRV